MTDEFHPVANAWPLLPEAELDDLAADIAAHGLHHAIWRHRDGRIIDGRNRWLACQKVGVECPSNRYQGEDGAELIAFVVSMNDKRRHMTESQRAMVAANLANLDPGRPNETSPIGLIKAVTQADAANLMNVGISSLKRAKVVKDSGDEEIIKAVESGEMSVNAAEKKVRQKAPPKPKAPTKPKPKPKLTVVQSDPPPHVIQLANLTRSFGMLIEKFADPHEAASLCSRFDINVSDEAVREIILFLSAFERARKAGQAA